MINKILKTCLIIVFGLLFCLLSAFGQKSVQIIGGIAYPYPNNRFYKHYVGIIDGEFGIGIKWRKKLAIGLAANLFKSKQKYTNVISRSVVTNVYVSYRYKIKNGFIFLPEIGTGLVFIKLKKDLYNLEQRVNGYGFIGKIHIGYTIQDRFDILLFYRYNYIYLAKNESFTKLNYYRIIPIYSIGIGFTLNI